MISYAQNFEDVMLWRALGHVEGGFYIDIGAQDPVVDSVSLAFYEKSWKGIHVEPTPHYAGMLRAQRLGDTVIEAAVANTGDMLAFFEIPETGISTADPQIAEQHRERGFEIRKITVPCVRLSSIFKICGKQEIQWMKIDVEGLEHSALRSWGKATARPWIVVVESTLPLTQIESHAQWEPLLLRRGYTPVYFDGLNRYYVSKEKYELKQAFNAPPNVFDNFSVSGTASTKLHQHLFDRHSSVVAEIEKKLELANDVISNLQQSASAVEIDNATRFKERPDQEEVDEELTLPLKSTRRDDIAALQSEVLQMSALVIAAKDAAATAIAVAHEDALTAAHALAGRERELADGFASIQEAHRAEISFLQAEVMRLGSLLTAAKDEFNGILQAHQLEALASSRFLVEHEREMAAKLVDAAKSECAALQKIEQQRLENVEEAYLESEQRMRAEISELVARELELSAQVLTKADAYSTLQRLADEERDEMHRLIASLRGDVNLLKTEHQQRELSLLSEISEGKDTLVKLQSAQIQIKDNYSLSLAKSHEANAKLQRLLSAAKQEQLDLVNTFSWRLTRPFRMISERMFSYRSSKTTRSTWRDAPTASQTDPIAKGISETNLLGVAPSFQQKVPMSPAMISKTASPLDRSAQSSALTVRTLLIVLTSLS
jgi:FkbM family methyltransferase